MITYVPPLVLVGQIVVWRCVPRGGYGFATRIPAQILKVTATRARIAFWSSSGRRYERTVAHESLRVATNAEHAEYISATNRTW